MIIKLLIAIFIVEHSGRLDTKDHDLIDIGPFQITQWALADYNEHHPKVAYKFHEMHDFHKAARAATWYMTYWANRRGLPRTQEWMAKVFNGGCNGYGSPSAATYWSAVKAVLADKKRIKETIAFLRLRYKEKEVIP